MERIDSLLQTMNLFAEGKGEAIEFPCLQCGMRWKVPPELKQVPPICPDCRNRAPVRELDRRWALLNVPADFRDSSLDNFMLHGSEASKAAFGMALHSVREWCRAPKPFLVMYGEPGSGKTRLAWSVVRELLRTMGDFRFLEFTDFISTIRDTWGQGGERERDVLHRLQNHHLLVIDDISSDKWPKDPARELFVVLNTRNDNRRPTVITTNETPETFYDLLGASMSSRVLGAGTKVGLPAEDFRLLP